MDDEGSLEVLLDDVLAGGGLDGLEDLVQTLVAPDAPPPTHFAGLQHPDVVGASDEGLGVLGLVGLQHLSAHSCQP